MIDVELKSERPFAGCECFCGEPATRVVTIGETHNYYGGYGGDYSLCEKPECVDEAFKNQIEEIAYIRTHRKELAQENRWEMRGNK